MGKERYIDADGHPIFFGHPNDDGAIAALANGGSVVPKTAEGHSQPPPDKLSKWDGAAWVPSQVRVDAAALQAWSDEMESADVTLLSRFEEDLYDRLTPAQQLDMPKSAQDKAAAKKLLRRQRP